MKSEPGEIEKLLPSKYDFVYRSRMDWNFKLEKENISSFLNYHNEILLSNFGLKKIFKSLEKYG